MFDGFFGSMLLTASTRAATDPKTYSWTGSRPIHISPPWALNGSPAKSAPTRASAPALSRSTTNFSGPSVGPGKMTGGAEPAGVGLATNGGFCGEPVREGVGPAWQASIVSAATNQIPGHRRARIWVRRPTSARGSIRRQEGPGAWTLPPAGRPSRMANARRRSVGPETAETECINNLGVLASLTSTERRSDPDTDRGRPRTRACNPGRRRSTQSR